MGETGWHIFVSLGPVRLYYVCVLVCTHVHWHGTSPWKLALRVSAHTSPSAATHQTRARPSGVQPCGCCVRSSMCGRSGSGQRNWPRRSSRAQSMASTAAAVAAAAPAAAAGDVEAVAAEAASSDDATTISSRTVSCRRRLRGDLVCWVELVETTLAMVRVRLGGQMRRRRRESVSGWVNRTIDSCWLLAVVVFKCYRLNIFYTKRDGGAQQMKNCAVFLFTNVHRSASDRHA